MNQRKFLPARKTKGKRFLTLRRRGKIFIGQLDNQSELVVHLGMTGQLKIVETINDPSDRTMSEPGGY